MIVICVGNGVSKNGRQYSKLAPVVTTDTGEYVNVKSAFYFDGLVPIGKRFKQSIADAPEGKDGKF